MKCEKCGEREATDVHLLKEFQDEVDTKNHQLVAKNHPEWFINLCSLCHAKIHGNDPKKSELKRLIVLRDRVIKILTALKNQQDGFSGIELKVPDLWRKTLKRWKRERDLIEKKIKRKLKSEDYPIWSKWLKNIKGIAEITAAKLISYIDLEKSPTVSSLWRYCGLDATHIKRKKGMSEKEAKKYGVPYLKKELLGVLADNFLRQRTPIYRDVYDRTKKKELKLMKEYGKGVELGDKTTVECRAHAHNRAKRKMIKIFISHYWTIGRQLKGLNTRPPYVHKKLKHDDYIKPPKIPKDLKPFDPF